MKRPAMPLLAFLLGCTLMATFYLGILAWAQGWEYASAQFVRDRGYVIPIILSFGAQAALYLVLRLRLFVPGSSTHGTGAVMGTSGGVSGTAMVACCIHHVTDALPILGFSAAAGFLTRYQRPFMAAGLAMNLLGLTVMLVVLYRQWRTLKPVMEAA